MCLCLLPFSYLPSTCKYISTLGLYVRTWKEAQTQKVKYSARTYKSAPISLDRRAELGLGNYQHDV